MEKNYLEFLNGNDMIKLKIEDNMYSIHKTRRDCKGLEDLNKRNNIPFGHSCIRE